MITFTSAEPQQQSCTGQKWLGQNEDAKLQLACPGLCKVGLCKLKRLCIPSKTQRVENFDDFIRDLPP